MAPCVGAATPKPEVSMTTALPWLTSCTSEPSATKSCFTKSSAPSRSMVVCVAVFCVFFCVMTLALAEVRSVPSLVSNVVAVGKFALPVIAVFTASPLPVKPSGSRPFNSIFTFAIFCFLPGCGPSGSSMKQPSSMCNTGFSSMNLMPGLCLLNQDGSNSVPEIRQSPNCEKFHKRGLPGTDFGRRKTISGMPETSFGLPATTFGTPAMTFGSPETIFGIPGMIFGLPEMKFRSPETRFGSPEMKFGSPEMKFGSPKVIL